MMSHLRRLIIAGFAVVLLVAVCSCEDEPAVDGGGQPGGVGAIRVASAEGPDRAPLLRVRLSHGGATPGESRPEVAQVEGEPLDEAEIRTVIDRLPPWENGDGGDGRAEFNRPPESLRPPRTGATVERPFPAGPDSQAPSVDPGPLEVLRVQPSGEVGIAPFVSITFNQPMVPITTLGQLDALDVPVAITPTLPGRWQWIGTRTLRFEHDPEVLDRLPMATPYVVEIPAGAKSQAGKELAEAVRFTFETPPPTLADLSPQHDSLHLQPVFLAIFDQRIEPAAALEAITLTASGQERAIRLATDDEIEADESIKRRSESAVDGTWLAFRPATPLPVDSDISIQVGPDLPSAEGPNTGSDSSVVTGRTYGPLQVSDTGCQPNTYECYPGYGLDIWFNNTLDPNTLDADEFSVSPQLPDAAISVSGRSIQIRGRTAGDTVYEVVIPGTLGDEFGQTLGAPQTLEFTIEEARPLLWSQGGDFATIDPLGTRQTIPVLVRQWEQLRVRLYRVEVSDIQAYRSFLSEVDRFRYGSDPSNPSFPEVPWTLSFEETIDTGIDHGDLVEVPIDLSPVLGGQHGHVVVIVEAAGSRMVGADWVWRNRPVVMWAQHTDIGVDLISHQDDLVVWTTDLRTGDPLAGVGISFAGAAEDLETDESGLVRTTLSQFPIDVVAATLGEDEALSVVHLRGEQHDDQTIWYTADDRGMYRPGETLNLKGWVRNLDLSGDGGLEFLPEGELIAYQVYDPFGNQLDSGTTRLDKLGGFHLSVDLSEQSNLGHGWIQFERRASGAESRHTHRFQIQEFRRPEFEVTTRTVAAGPYFVDEPAEVAVDAKYFSGGSLPNAEVTWTVTTRQATYSPPNWSDFTFGVWRPWWYGGDGYWPGDPWVELERETLTGRTDAGGTHVLRIDFEGDADHLPSAVTAQAEVLDVNRQQWASTTDLLVHPSRLYVGLRSARAFVKAGDGLEIQAVVTDIDGNAVPGRPFHITAGRIVSQFADGEWVEVAVDEESCEITSAEAPISCEFAAASGGRYRIDARVGDDSGHINRSELTRWVSGGGDSAPNRTVELEAAELIPDSEAYEAGDTAELLVVSPFESATGLLTVVHSQIIETRTFEVSDHAAVLTIPISDDHVPELAVQVELVSVAQRTADDGTVIDGAPPRPAYASGQVTLRVPPLRRVLDVAATPASAVVEPGSSMSIEVQVSDAEGAPVEGADVLLMVVDEAVLALSGYELMDPINVFYSPWGVYLRTFRSRSEILLDNAGDQPEDGEDQGRTALTSVAGSDAEEAATASDDMVEAAFDGAGGADSDGTPIDVRQNLDALALFDPKAVTDAQGRVAVEFDLPDNLTRYRVMAVAVSGAERFGSAESAITARLPLQVRPSAPRFLNFGDEFELPIVVQNQTDAVMVVDVVVQASNLQLLGSPGRRIEVPANDRVEVRFPARTISPGEARLRAVAASASGDHADAQTVSLPVYTPATSEAFATYGVVDQGAAIQPIAAPTDVIPQFGGLEVNTSSTALQALTDAVLYLTEYRYASSDAYASRILAISALRDVLDAFEAEGLGTPDELDAVVRRDIADLSALQNYDGGFGWWSRRAGSYPYPSIQAMHALLTARESGFTVATDVIQDGLWYLENIEGHIPDDLRQRTKDMLAAYALHVRGLAGDGVSRDARGLWNRGGADLGLDALAWIWPLVDDEGIESEIERVFDNRVVETAGAATFTTDYGEDAYLILHSDRRTDGIVLDALIAMAPESDLIPKVVAGLLGNQIKGRWSNVQENSFILLALNRYFDAFEATDPDFVARVWLGDLYAAQHEFAGRNTDRGFTLVPMEDLLVVGDADLIVQKDGEGRLYYRLGLRYAPDDLDLDPLDRGFVVQRSYEAIDDPDDVWLDDDGVWHVRAGAEVRVNLTMVNDSRRTNMALVDPMPAGFEPLNPALAVTGEVDNSRRGGGRSWWSWTWYEHQNLRDDRAEAFSSYLWAGVHEYSYVARATTPGTFVVPPAKAEEIYAPEVFGRSGADTVIVQDQR